MGALADAIRSRDMVLYVAVLLESLADPDEPAPNETWGPLRLAIEHGEPK